MQKSDIKLKLQSQTWSKKMSKLKKTELHAALSRPCSVITAIKQIRKPRFSSVCVIWSTVEASLPANTSLINTLCISLWGSDARLQLLICSCLMPRLTLEAVSLRLWFNSALGIYLFFTAFKRSACSLRPGGSAVDLLGSDIHLNSTLTREIKIFPRLKLSWWGILISCPEISEQVYMRGAAGLQDTLGTRQAGRGWRHWRVIRRRCCFIRRCFKSRWETSQLRFKGPRRNFSCMKY